MNRSLSHIMLLILVFISTPTHILSANTGDLKNPSAVESDSTIAHAPKDQPATAADYTSLLKIDIDKDTIQLGDSVICNIYLATNIPVITHLQFDEPLEIDSCDVRIIEVMEGKNSKINNVSLIKYNLFQYVIKPQTVGTFRINPIAISGVGGEILIDSIWTDMAIQEIPFKLSSEAADFVVTDEAKTTD